MLHKTFKASQNTLKLELLGDPLNILLKEQHWSGYASLSELILEILEKIRL